MTQLNKTNTAAMIKSHARLIVSQVNLLHGLQQVPLEHIPEKLAKDMNEAHCVLADAKRVMT